MPGSTPPTSQRDWLISTTAMIVLLWSKATRDLLKSFGWGFRALHQLDAAAMVPSPRHLPHTHLAGGARGFELSVPLAIDHTTPYEPGHYPEREWLWSANRANRMESGKSRR